MPKLLPSWRHSPWNHKPPIHSFLWMKKSKFEAWFVFLDPLRQASWGTFIELLLLLSPHEEALPHISDTELPPVTYVIFSGYHYNSYSSCVTLGMSLRASISLIYKMGRCYLSLVLPNPSSCCEVQMRYVIGRFAETWAVLSQCSYLRDNVGRGDSGNTSAPSSVCSSGKWQPGHGELGTCSLRWRLGGNQEVQRSGF